jgi:hypothetical protein
MLPVWDTSIGLLQPFLSRFYNDVFFANAELGEEAELLLREV